jgi:dipeptidyl aminopeptidase/acylaminoacyl peptidase
MKPPFVPSDLYRVVLAADPHVSPDGGAIFYRRTHFDRERDAICGALWRVGADGGARRFTTGSNDRLPRLSRDGTQLAFVADRDGAAGLSVMRTDGGEAHAAGEPYPKITALAWSPDGTRLAYCATAAHDHGRAHVYLDETSGARHVRALPYKSDLEGLLDGRRQQLFVLDPVLGTIEQCTNDDADVSAPAWSPDGEKIAFAASTGEEGGSITDIFVLDRANGERRKLTSSDGPMGWPAFSNDGRRLAFVGHRKGNDARVNAELFVVSLDGDLEPRSISARFDRSIGNFLSGDLRSHGSAAPVWSNDDRSILVLVSESGSCVLRAIASDGSDWRIVAGGEREIYGFSQGPDGTLAIVYATPLEPSRVALVTAEGERTMTDCNPWLAEKDLVAPERFRPPARDGVTLDAWLLRPSVDVQAPQPLILEVHGGPHAAYGFTFFLEFQILAGLGFAVVYGNPRGSQSYGQEYASAITGDWGGRDADDVLAILDGALARGVFDTARLGCAGGSYGGFMTTWLLGHSDRFAAGISMRAVNDHLSLYGATDIGWFLEPELDVRVADDAGRALFERSPIRSAAKIDAALLIMHSERDYRCPIDQGEQLFNTLRMLGKRNVEFVRFTGDGHELSRSGRPRHRVLRLRAIAHWFLRHLGPAAEATPRAGDLFGPLPGEALLDSEPSLV